MQYVTSCLCSVAPGSVFGSAVKMLSSGVEYGNVDNDECRSKNGSSELESKDGWTDGNI